MFEAQIAPDIRVVDNFRKASQNVLRPERPRVFAYTIFGTFLTRLRMFNEASNPVRTPSYMPKATIQLAWLKNLSTEKPSETTEFLKGPVEMWLVNAIPFGHHSNGQNGCLFTGQTRIDDECMPQPPPSTAPEAVNQDNGSFSTNYIRLGLEYRRLYPSGEDTGELPVAAVQREWGVGGSIELNPSGYIGGSISDTLKPLYGTTRFRVSANVLAGNWRPPLLKRVNCGRAWAEASVMFIRDAAPSVDDATISVEAACLPAGWGGAGLFVRYYRGQDYYNAAFLENINRVQFGVTFLQGRFLTFATHN